jgi:NitT/TauT family transport system permease protein
MTPSPTPAEPLPGLRGPARSKRRDADADFDFVAHGRRFAAATLPPLLFILILAGAWEVMAVVQPNPLIPRLGDIAGEFQRILAKGLFVTNMLATLGRVLLGSSMGFLLAVAVGIPTARSARWQAFFEPGIQLGLTVPGLVWALLCIIWFGVSTAGAAAAIALSIAPALLLNVQQGVRAVSADLLDVARVLRLSQLARLRYLWLPALIPFLLSGARLGLSLAWKVIVLVEVFGMSSGIGYQLNAEFSAQNVAGVIAWTLGFCAVMAAIEYGLLRKLERYVTRWRRPAKP